MEAMSKTEKFVQAALSQIGVAWKHQGRIPGKHLDCLGLLVYAGREAGVVDPEHDSFNYRREGNVSDLDAAIMSYCEQVKRNEIQRGDILLFRGENMNNHLGVALDERTFVHAYAVNRKVTIGTLSHYWLNRVSKVYRFKG